jgi:hypothetical protein
MALMIIINSEKVYKCNKSYLSDRVRLRDHPNDSLVFTSASIESHCSKIAYIGALSTSGVYGMSICLRHTALVRFFERQRPYYVNYTSTPKYPTSMTHTVTPTQLVALRETLLNISGATPLHERFRALFMLKAIGTDEVVKIVSDGMSLSAF